MDHHSRPRSPKRHSRHSDNEDDYERDQHGSSDPSKRVEAAIYNLGNEARQGGFNADIDALVQLIVRHYSAAPEAVIGSVVACLVELPHKTDLLATVLGVLHGSAGRKEIVELVLDRLSQLMASDDLCWWHLVQMPRIFVELANVRVLSAAQLDAFLQSTASTAIDASAAGELIALGVLLSLPWMKADMLASLASMDQVFARIGAVVESTDRHSLSVASQSTLVAPSLLAYPQGDFLLAAFGAVRNLQAFPARREPYRSFESAFGDAGLEFEAAWTSEHTSQVSVAQHFPLNLWAAAADDFTLMYHRFQTHMLIEAYELNHRRAAEALFTSLPETLEAPERLICDVLFGKLVSCKLDYESRASYYEVLLIDCCRLSRAFPPAMARSLLKLVATLDEGSDLGVAYNLARWFAHHLSHYDFKWNWTEWRSVAAEDGAVTCKRVFLRYLLFQLLCLSYPEKLEATVPDYILKTMLPVEQQAAEPAALSTAAQPSESMNAELLARMKQRLPVPELREFIAQASISEESVLETLLFLGSKTFSHLLNALERYRTLWTAPLEAAMAWRVIGRLWVNSIQNQHIVLDKLLHYEMLDLTATIQLILEEAARVSEQDFELQMALRLLEPKFVRETLLRGDAQVELFVSGLRSIPFDGIRAWYVAGLLKLIS